MNHQRESLLLWNMNFHPKAQLSDKVRSSRLGVLKRMVTEISPSIVALQEAPSNLRRRRALGSDYQIIDGPCGIVTAFLKARWRLREHRHVARERALVIKIDSSSRRLCLWVWNVHLPVLHKELKVRHEFVRNELREALRTLRDADPDRRELIVGDFNLPPYADAMVEQSGLHANRSHAWVESKTSPHEIRRRPLFNPTWALLGRQRPPLGSFYGERLPDGPWLIPDQALMSPDLAFPGEPQVSIVERVGTEDLCAQRDRAPKKDVGSDHLPLHVQFRAA